MTFPSAPSASTPARVRRWAGAVAVVAGSLSLAACAADDPTPASSDATEPDRPTKKPRPSASQEPSPTATETSEPAASVVPVYYVGDGPDGKPRLFREFHRVTGDPLTEAAKLLVAGQPDDPDYRTLWPQVEVSASRGQDGTIVVDLPGDAFTERPDGMSERAAELAIQQLVYTLQGVQQERAPVQVERGGTDVRLFGLATDRAFTAASPLETLNLVNITSPAEGDTVTGDTLTVTGVANSFEASGPCRLLVDGVEMVLQGYQSEGWMEDRLFPFEVDFPLEGISGEVVVQCETDDPSGGAEGNGPSVDTKLIHVG